MKRSTRPANSNPRRTGALEEAVFLDLLRTTDLLSRRLVPVLKESAVSPAQYNVLRILRGAPEGLTCGEIAGRLITRDPDITRLLDRMEKRGLITRERQKDDRRVVKARITPHGLALLKPLDQPMRDLHKRQFRRIAATHLKTLYDLLEEIRCNQQE